MKIEIGNNLALILGFIVLGVFAICLKLVAMIDGFLPHLERLIP